jgi:Golgi CORVET complex core vacuolar protein 8
MDYTIVDFNTILSLLKTKEMYTSLMFVFNQGLDDLREPLDILLEKVFDAFDLGHASYISASTKGWCASK